MSTISKQMIDAYFECNDANPRCCDCALYRTVKIENEDVFMCVLFTQFTEKIFDKIMQNMFK